MNVGEVLHGFRIDRVRELPEIGAKMWEMEHVGCGAQLVWLDREDENKTFSIAFKTLPEDSTGVFHILEHSVLCGSDKYPVKEPFVELLKSSVQTFLNAMTYPDKTVYPVSSRNDQDFLNLTDVYLDAVLHPAIYRKPEIFRQEGWRFERQEDGTYCRQGVVLNEMKGSYSSPDEVMWQELNRLMYPDNCYRFSSGGDPERIPDLTYEQFIAQHRKYYHPSNARISLCGSVPLERVLEKINSYLGVYDRQPAIFDIPFQTPITGTEARVLYEIGADEATTEKTVLACGSVIGTFADQKELFAAHILADYLAGDNESPLKRAVLQVGLGQDVRIEISDYIQQPGIVWEVWNTDEEKIPEVHRVIRKTLTDLVETALDKEALKASFNRFAFRKRDRDSSGEPRSLIEAIFMLDSWLYGGDPAQPLLAEDALNAVEAELEGTYFESLIRKWFLENGHQACVTLVPAPALGAEKRKKEADEIAAICGAWSEEQIAEQEKRAAQLDAWQKSPDAPEDLKKIPILQLSDLSAKPEPLKVRKTTVKNTTVLRHDLGNDLVYDTLYFNASDLAPEELPDLALSAGLLGQFATEERDRVSLRRRIKQTTGKFYFDVVPLPGEDASHAQVLFSASAVFLKKQETAATELLAEVLTKTRPDDRNLLRDILKQLFLDGQAALTSRGHRYALTRAEAYQTALGAAKEQLTGFSYLCRIKEYIASDDSALDALLSRLSAMIKRIVTADRLTVSVSETAQDSSVISLIEAFPRSGQPVARSGIYAPLSVFPEGIRIPAGVGFAAKASHLEPLGRNFSGTVPVLGNILNFHYLWNTIRVQGGAYGCGFGGRDDGTVYYYTYRDPSPERSVGCFNGAADFLRSFCREQPDLTKYILGSVSDFDPLLNAEQKMSLGERRYFKGTSYEDVCRYYDELRRTTAADLMAWCDVLDAVAQEEKICVVGGQGQLDACGKRLKTILSL